MVYNNLGFEVRCALPYYASLSVRTLIVLCRLRNIGVGENGNENVSESRWWEESRCSSDCVLSEASQRLSTSSRPLVANLL